MPLPWWAYVIVPGTVTAWILFEPKLWRWEQKLLNAREAARRSRVIEFTLAGMLEIFTTNLEQEMDPGQEKAMGFALDLGRKWQEKRGKA